MSVLPIPVKDAAVVNNQRIFNTYEASLSDTAHYIEFAGKFALWLDSDRAFYAQGKPSVKSCSHPFFGYLTGSLQIVSILMVQRVHGSSVLLF